MPEEDGGKFGNFKDLTGKNNINVLLDQEKINISELDNVVNI